MKRLLYLLSVTDRTVVSESSDRAQLIQRLSGLTILLTGVLAYLSGFFFCQTLVDEVVPSLLVAGLWFLMIITIDRSLFVASNKWSVLLRFVLAIVLGFIISVPLELGIMDGRISAYINNQQARAEKAKLDKKGSLQERYYERKTELQRQIGLYEANITKYQSLRDGEVTGRQYDPLTNTYTDRPEGKGVRYRQYQATLDNSKRNLQTARQMLADLEADYQEQLTDYQQYYALTQESFADDFLSRYIAMEELKSEREPSGELTTEATAATTINWALRILFIVIEVIPALLKLTLKETDYHETLKARDHLLRESSIEIADAALDQVANNPGDIPDPSFWDKMTQFLRSNTRIVKANTT